MDQGQYQILKQYVGLDLIEFVLNFQRKISDSDLLIDLALNPQQISVLNALDSLIQSCRIKFITDGGFGNDVRLMLKVSGIDVASYLHDLRKQSGGNVQGVNHNSDPIKQVICDQALKYYPLLLLNPIDEQNRFNLFSIDHTISQGLVELVQGDVLVKLTNGKSNLDAQFEVNTDIGIQEQSQVISMPEVLLSRAFANCCARMKYEMSDFLIEVESLIENLRFLAKFGRMEFSSFLGFRGLYFDGFDEIDFGDAIVRQLKWKSNPGKLTALTFSTHSDGNSNKSIGAIAELKHKTERIALGNRPGSCVDGTVYRAQQCFVDRFLMAIVLHLKKDRGISRSGTDIGFPLGFSGLSWSERYPSEIIILSKADIDPVKEWMELLTDPVADAVSIAVRRLLKCVYERDNPEDGLIDAFIAWEAMFTASSETTFRVTGSLVKYLYAVGERADQLKRLKKLYKLRSGLVHGSGSKLSSEEISKARVDAFEVALNALSKLLKEPSMLKMKPEERTEELLIIR